MDWSKYRLGRRCRECRKETMSKKFRHPYNYVKKYIEKKGDILISDEYINSGTKISIKCGKCDAIFMKTFDCYKRAGCNCCRSISLGESAISKYLNNIGISYMTEVRFKDCIHKNQLPFDFHIPELNLCIEFDGIQHYKPVEHFGGQENFKLTKKRDEIKNKYCADNNIRLIRIAYFDIDNIKTILDKLLLQYIIDDLVNSD